MKQILLATSLVALFLCQACGNSANTLDDFIENYAELTCSLDKSQMDNNCDFQMPICNSEEFRMEACLAETKGEMYGDLEDEDITEANWDLYIHRAENCLDAWDILECSDMYVDYKKDDDCYKVKIKSAPNEVLRDACGFFE